MGRIAALWNRGLWGKVVIVVAGLLLLSCVFGALGRGRTPQQAAAPAGQTQATVAPAPTRPPQPTETPAPTSTPAPTETPSPIPSPVPPLELAGSGQTVTDPFTPPAGLNRVLLTHQGKRNFIVHVFKPDGEEENLVNEIGSYTGSRPLSGSASGKYYFEIDADGPWTIRVEPIPGEPAAAQGIEGAGDYVSGVFAPVSTGPIPYTVAHDGKRNFIVHLYCTGGDDSVQNEIGQVRGSVVVRFAEGPCFWDVQADGAWSLKPK